VAQKANLSFKNKFSYISVIDKASDFKYGTPLRCTKAGHQIPQKKKWVWPWAKIALKIWDFWVPFNISATAGASDFTFCLPLVFAKAHHQITCRGKSGCDPGLGELP